jgi:UDPglucose 6-dehydrogenase
MFNTIMQAREVQARNLADFLCIQAQKHNLPIVIHGKAYKPDVPYCIGSYSTLIGHYVEAYGHHILYVDPLADNIENVISTVDTPAVVLMAHNRHVTYGYTGEERKDSFYYDIKPGSVIVDPWRTIPLDTKDMKVIHYGNTRNRQV